MNKISKKKMDFRMPAEWEPHKAVWLAWPHDKVAFPKLEKVERDVAVIIKALYLDEQVELLVLNDEMSERAKEILRTAGVDAEKISYRTAEYVGGWMRDCSGIFVRDKDGKMKLVNWLFSSWGNKFPDLLIDAKLPPKIAEWAGVEMESPGIVLEGGSIELNGEGTLLTTEQCLLNPNRNPELRKDEIEAYLKSYLGVKKIIWLKEGLVGDHTDGHIDDIAKFIAPGKILCAYEDDPNDENYKTLKENYEALQKETDMKGRPFTLIKLPMPHLYYNNDKPFEKGKKAPASYVNFYIGNRAVLIPKFNDPNDKQAEKIIQEYFPGKKVVPIDCRDLIYGGGAVHCLTQQEPI